MHLIAVVILTWMVVSRVLKKKPSGSVDSADRFSPSRHWALTLGQPMLDAHGWDGLFSPTANRITEDTRTRWRGALLHQLGIRTDASDDAARAHLEQRFEKHWFSADLDALRPDDDPRAALAFACVRIAFLARVTMLLGWVDTQAAWRVLLLNAQRARECFTSWEDFGNAYIAGRTQWVKALRADPLGKAFEPSQLQALLARKAAWGALPWPGQPLALPLPTIQASCSGISG